MYYEKDGVETLSEPLKVVMDPAPHCSWEALQAAIRSGLSIGHIYNVERTIENKGQLSFKLYGWTGVHSSSIFRKV